MDRTLLRKSGWKYSPHSQGVIIAINHLHFNLSVSPKRHTFALEPSLISAKVYCPEMYGPRERTVQQNVSSVFRRKDRLNQFKTLLQITNTSFHINTFSKNAALSFERRHLFKNLSTLKTPRSGKNFIFFFYPKINWSIIFQRRPGDNRHFY